MSVHLPYQKPMLIGLTSTYSIRKEIVNAVGNTILHELAHTNAIEVKSASYHRTFFFKLSLTDDSLSSHPYGNRVREWMHTEGIVISALLARRRPKKTVSYTAVPSRTIVVGWEYGGGLVSMRTKRAVSMVYKCRWSCRSNATDIAFPYTLGTFLVAIDHCRWNRRRLIVFEWYTSQSSSYYE